MWQASRCTSGLATPTKLQNRLKMNYAGRLHSACYGSDNEGSGPEAETEEPVLNEDLFADDVAHLTHTIEDLSKLIRFDHLQKSDSKAAKLEAARREKEAEIRRVRKKEQMAKDPSRKVALKIERGRREKQEMLETLAKVPNAEISHRRMSKDIPLVPFHAPGCGSGNKDPVPVVDVKKIQRSCEGLGHHQNATEMLILRRRREVGMQEASKTSSCHVSLNESYKYLSLSSLFDGCTLEDRLAKVKAQCDNLAAQKMRRRLRNMRSDCPAYLVRAWGVASAKGSPHGGSMLLLESDSDSDWNGSEVASRRGSFNSSRRSSEERSTGPQKKFFGSRRTVNSLSPAMFAKARPSAARPSAQHMDTKQDLQKQRAVSKRVRRRKLQLRACVQWLKILFRKRRLDRSVDACLVLLRQLGEWVRIRGAVKEFVNHVKSIQRVVREYFTMKRRRCHVIEKEWCRLEDMHLATHAKYLAQKAMQEDKTSKVKAKRRILQAALEASVSNKWKLVVDFSSQRIPLAERRALIAAYHKRAIKHHLCIGKTFLQLVSDAMLARRELDNFLNHFHYGGGTKSVVESMEIRKEDLVTSYEKESSELSYWQMPEAVILKLVACCAQTLGHVSSFKEHPANQAIPSSKRRPWPEYVVGSDPHEFADFVMMQIDRPVYRGRFGRHPALREEDILFEEERRNAHGAKPGSRYTQTGTEKQQRRNSMDIKEEVPHQTEIQDVDQALMNFTPRSLATPQDRRLLRFTSAMTLGSTLDDEEGADGDSPLRPNQEWYRH